jgi:hypothetical protein
VTWELHEHGNITRYHRQYHMSSEEVVLKAFNDVIPMKKCHVLGKIWIIPPERGCQPLKTLVT